MTWFFLADIAVLTFLLCLGLASQAGKLNLLAMPGEHRQHQTPTPMVGGIALFFGLLAGNLLFNGAYKSLLPCLFLMCVVGVVDDRYGLPSSARFLAQGIAAYLMIKLTGVQISTFGFLVSDKELLLDSWSVPVTIFAVIGVINAINMSDGLDGLAGTLTLITVIALLLMGSPDEGLALVTVSALIGFLILNVRIGRSQARVFMGDAGSTMLGLLLSYLLINASQNSDAIAPVTALWLLALPLIDAVSALIVRPIKGRSAFSADRIHYHHQILDLGLSVNATLVMSIVFQFIFTLIGVFFEQSSYSQALQFYSFMMLFAIYFGYLIRKA